jgi:hypothetical protein
LRTKSVVDQAITSAVGGDLAQPELRAALWSPAAARMPVPEISVHKQGDSTSGKNEIRAAKKLLLTPPSSDPIEAKQTDHPKLRRLIALALDQRHPLGTFLRRQRIHTPGESYRLRLARWAWIAFTTDPTAIFANSQGTAFPNCRMFSVQDE